MQSKDNDFPSFLGRSGHFYVRVRSSTGGFTNRVAVYPDVESYDQRRSLPFFIGLDEALKDYAENKRIYLEALTTTPPPLEAWAKESAEDVYRNTFWSRVNAMEVQNYAA